MTSKSKVVTVEMLNEAAFAYTELRKKASFISRSIDKAHNNLQSLLKRASATTVKAYMVGSVNDMHKIPNPNLEKSSNAEK